MKRVYALVAFALAVALAGCSGGGSAPTGAMPAPAPSPAAISGPQSSGTLVIVIGPKSGANASSRKAQFVSPSSSSVAISLNGQVTAYADVSSTSPNCTTTSGTRTCNIAVTAPVGALSVSLQFYDGATGAGTLLGGGLGTTTVVAGTPFTLTIPISPVVATATTPVLTYNVGTSFVLGTPGSATLSYTFADPDGNTIPAATTFLTPLTIVSTSPHVTVSSSAWTGTSQVVTLTYDGSSATFGASVTVSTVSPTTTLATQKFFSSTVSTFAGTGTAGFANGAGSSATFSSPIGICVDGSGNVYVGDHVNNAIRMITPAGAVTTLAGTGTSGFGNGPGASATFDGPEGVAVDHSGNVYVADAGNNAIRVIAPGGAVSTLAGTGASSFVNGPAASATFNSPAGVAVDASGDVFVADDGNNAIREISGGVVTTVAGTGVAGFTNGAAASATFKNPIGIAIDTSGTLYVADNNNGVVRKIAGGNVTTLATLGPTGLNPLGVAVDSSGNVFEVGNDIIAEISPAGVATTVAGTAGVTGFLNGPAASATFNIPFGLALDASENIYVADDFNNAIRKIAP